jgi:molybdopterin-guanine dinucleotide biosynthesis protein A
MDVDAIVLAGGSSTRLGGTDKAALRVGGRTLLQRTLDAVSGARHVVVVGPALDDAAVLTVQEDPPGGGPAAAIAAGVRALPDDAAVVLVLACDMPGIAAAVPVLLDALSASPDVQAVVARDGERLQHLAAAHRGVALRSVVERRDLDGASVRSLLADLVVLAVDVPPGSTADVDTWADARAAGVAP